MDRPEEVSSARQNGTGVGGSVKKRIPSRRKGESCCKLLATELQVKRERKKNPSFAQTGLPAGGHMGG